MRGIRRIFCMVLVYAPFHAFAQVPTDLPFQKSIEEVSQYFLNKPYKLGPLGEGANGAYDQDPLYRFDEFDCQTYVETVLALHRSSNFEEFEKQMNFVRYADDEISYVKRLHFSESQWVPDNEAKEIFADVSDRYGSECTDVKIDYAAWYEQQKLQVGNCASAEVGLTYVPKTALTKEFAATIPSGSILLFVRTSPEAFACTPVMVSHMGFVVDKKNVKYFRHAAYNKTVMDVEISAYFEKMLASKSFVGIKILDVDHSF